MTISRSAGFTGVVCCLTAIAACAKQNQQPAATDQPAAQVDRRAADEAAIRAADAEWVKAIAAKNADQVASYYADDASLMYPGQPMTTGKDSIRKGFAGLMASPGFGLTFAPTKVVVAGDLGYEVGDYQMTTGGKKGKPQVTKAKYVVVWGRQSDGTWKALLDVPTTTP